MDGFICAFSLTALFVLLFFLPDRKFAIRSDRNEPMNTIPMHCLETDFHLFIFDCSHARSNMVWGNEAWTKISDSKYACSELGNLAAAKRVLSHLRWQLVENIIVYWNTDNLSCSRPMSECIARPSQQRSHLRPCMDMTFGQKIWQEKGLTDENGFINYVALLNNRATMWARFIKPFVLYIAVI